MISILIVTAGLSQNLPIGDEWSPMWEVPVRSAVTKRVTLLKVRYNYWENRYYPKLTDAQAAWMRKYGHYLLDWRWDLDRGRWVRKAGPRMCLT